LSGLDGASVGYCTKLFQRSGASNSGLLRISGTLLDIILEDHAAPLVQSQGININGEVLMLKLGLNCGYWGAMPIGLCQPGTEADRLGYHSLWTAEAYGSDAVSPLVWLAAKTERIKVGTAILQMTARVPAVTAMTAATIDLLTGGRMLLGIGASGPQVVEGWHGVPYGKPVTRAREYVEILRKVWKRDEPLQFHGEHYDIPIAGGSGLR
jgi:hypothetical protein